MQNQRKARAAAHEVKFSASTRHVPDQDPGWGCKVIENSRRRHVPGRQHPGWGCKVIKNSGRPARDRQLPPEEQDWILHQKAGWKCHHPGAPGEEDQAAMRRANVRSVVLKHAPDGHLLRRTPSQHDWAAAAKRVQLEGERARGPVRADGEGRDAYLLDNYEFVSEHHIRRKPATAPTCSLLDKMRPHDALTGNQMLADGANQNNRYRPWNVRGLEKLQPAVDENVWEPKYRDGRPGWKQWKRAAAHVNPPHMHQVPYAFIKRLVCSHFRPSRQRRILAPARSRTHTHAHAHTIALTSTHLDMDSHSWTALERKLLRSPAC